MNKILVYGGTGSQARPIVDHALANGHLPIVVTRNASSAADLKALGATIVQSNMSDALHLKEITQDIDTVSFLLPAFLGDGDDAAAFGRNVIDAAVACGVRNFIWNASGPIPDDISDAKAQILDYLQKSGLDWVVFEPTTYMENWLGPWTAPFVIKDNEVSYPALEQVKMGWLASDDVGKLVVSAFEKEKLTNKRYNISGIEAPTGPELAKLFSVALGREIKYRAMTPEQMGDAIDQAFGAGVGERIAEMYRQEQNDPDPEPKFHDMEEVLDIFPVKMTTIEDWVRGHQNAFK